MLDQADIQGLLPIKLLDRTGTKKLNLQNARRGWYKKAL